MRALILYPWLSLGEPLEDLGEPLCTDIFESCSACFNLCRVDLASSLMPIKSPTATPVADKCDVSACMQLFIFLQMAD